MGFLVISHGVIRSTLLINVWSRPEFNKTKIKIRLHQIIYKVIELTVIFLFEN